MVVEWFLLLAIAAVVAWLAVVAWSFERHRRDYVERAEKLIDDRSHSEFKCRDLKSRLDSCRYALAKAERALELMKCDLEQYKDAALDYERLAGERAVEIRELKERLEEGRRVLGTKVGGPWGE